MCAVCIRCMGLGQTKGIKILRTYLKRKYIFSEQKTNFLTSPKFVEFRYLNENYSLLVKHIEEKIGISRFRIFFCVNFMYRGK